MILPQQKLLKELWKPAKSGGVKPEPGQLGADNRFAGLKIGSGLSSTQARTSTQSTAPLPMKLVLLGWSKKFQTGGPLWLTVIQLVIPPIALLYLASYPLGAPPVVGAVKIARQVTLPFWPVIGPTVDPPGVPGAVGGGGGGALNRFTFIITEKMILPNITEKMILPNL